MGEKKVPMQEGYRYRKYICKGKCFITNKWSKSLESGSHTKRIYRKH